MAVEHAPVPASEDISVVGVTKSFGGQPVLRGVDLDVPRGSVVALLGPSGCGKTTLLRVVAGLEVPDAGVVQVGDRVLTGPRGLVPPERRRVGLVFQDWALFPHLTVARNVAYGLPREERRRRSSPRVQAALDMVGLRHLGERMPATLSGGQQQRVALARALAPRPSVLLLDEPFSNLDATLRVQVRTEVHRLLADLGITTLFVTHDQEEAFVLGDSVAVMADGAVVQQGTPAQLYEEPATPWVATFVGEANLLRGRATGTTARTVVGEVPLRRPVDGPVQVLVRPEDVEVSPGSAALIRGVEYHGHDTVYDLVVDGPDGLDGQPDEEGLRVRITGAPTLSRGASVAVRYTGGAALAWSQPAAG